VSQVVSGDVFGGRGFFERSWGHIVAAWTIWFERRVVNCEARVSRSCVDVLSNTL
jgi:hypothetical protein